MVAKQAHSRRMKIVSTIIVCAVALASGYFLLKNHPIRYGWKKKEIIGKAEEEFVKRYGKEVLEQRPWILTEESDMYIIRGTFHDIRAVGGVAEMKVRKATGEMFDITHSL